MNATSSLSDQFPDPTLYILGMHSFAAISIPLHVLHVWAIVFRTPPYAKTYSNKLLHHIAWSFSTEFLLTSGITPVVILPVPAAYSGGFLRYLGISMQLQMIIGFTVIIELGVTCVHLYYFRYITIITKDHFMKRKSSRTCRICGVLFVYSLPITLTPPIVYLSFPTQSLAKADAVKKYSYCLDPRLFNDETFAFALQSDATVPLLASECILALVFFAVILFSLLFIYGSFKHSRISGISSKTRYLQRRFYWAIAIQTSVYAIVFALPVFFLLVILIFGDLCIPGVINFLIFILSTHSSCGTLSNLIANQSYRRGVKELFMKVRLNPNRFEFIPAQKQIHVSRSHRSVTTILHCELMSLRLIFHRSTSFSVKLKNHFVIAHSQSVTSPNSQVFDFPFVFLQSLNSPLTHGSFDSFADLNESSWKEKRFDQFYLVRPAHLLSQSISDDPKTAQSITAHSFRSRLHSSAPEIL